MRHGVRKLKKLTLLVAVVAATAAPLAVADPVLAAPGGGGFVFHGSATLPTFPCTTACPGSFDGLVDAQMAGVDGTNAWEVSYVEAQATASFTYRDNGLNCLVGEADGSVTMRPTVPNSVFGVYGASPLPNAVVDATLTANFHWIRAGTTARLALFNVRLVLTVDPQGPPAPFTRTVLSGGDGEAVATFAPLPSLDVPDCIAMVHPVPITAAVAGTGALEDHT